MPGNGWNAKDEKQYEHIKESVMDDGKSVRKATEIAARTVNKRRREEGRTSSSRTMGTGNPNTSLEERTKDELENIAEDLKIRGRSSMRKAELVAAIRERRS